MLLYHGTCASNLNRISKSGIKPRSLHKRKGNFAHTLQSHKDRVYLTNAYSMYFAFCAAKDQKGLILEVNSDLIEKNLMADEDCIEQMARETPQHQHDMISRTRKAREVAPTLQAEGRFTWENSLDYLGTCAHQGTIPPEAITGYVIFDTTKAIAFSDPVISVNAFKFMGDYYKALSSYVFGRREGLLSMGPGTLEISELVKDCIIDRVYHP